MSELSLSATRAPIRNPRTGLNDYELLTPSGAELSATALRLRAAQGEWATRSIEERGEALRAWRVALSARREALIDALTLDTGRYRESALEVDLVLRSLDRWALVAPQLLSSAPEQASALPGVHLQQRRLAYPLVGVISPWNFPLLLALIDTIPALMAGCAVLLKPSEITPRWIEVLREALERTPSLSGSLALVCGGPELGQAVVQLSDYICFTGSVPTGRRVAEACAARLIPANLELGGKDPAVVLEGADLERVSAALCWGGMVNAGQSCLSIERVYVHERLFEPLAQRLVERAQALHLNDQDVRIGELGPIIAARQAEVIQAHLADARARGADLLCGGEVVERGGGLYCLPTILTGVTHEALVMSEETFGPILPLMSFRDEEEAIALANDSRYGLSGAVFGPDEASALRVAQRLVGGAISVQDAALTSMVHEAEKHAFKLSGLGNSRMGSAALARFTRSQALMINRNLSHNPWWF